MKTKKIIIDVPETTVAISVVCLSKEVDEKSFNMSTKCYGTDALKNILVEECNEKNAEFYTKED